MDTKEKILNVLHQINDLKLVNQEYARVEQSRKLIKTSIAEVLASLDKKYSEIKELEDFSFKKIIVSVFGNKKKALEEKRDEYFNLSQRYEDLKKESATIDFEYNILNSKLNTLTKLRTEFEVLVERREKELLNEDSAKGQTLKQVVNDIFSELENKEKVEMSIGIIDKLLNKLTLLSAALREIESSNSWNRRRNRSYSSIQRSRALAAAKDYNLDSKLLLNKLENSLRFVGFSNLNISLRLLKFDNFSGNVFQNIFSDLIIQKRVADAVVNVENVYKKVKRLKVTLNDKLNHSDQTIERLEAVKQKIILE